MRRRDSAGDRAPIEYGPRLVELAVRAVLERGCNDLDPKRLLRLRLDHRLRLDALYRLPFGEEREAAFQGHFRRLFGSLGLDRYVPQWLELFPVVRLRLVRILVRSTLDPDREGVELYEHQQEQGKRVPSYLLVDLVPSRFSRPGAMRTFLLPRLLMAADVLDPDFGFDEKAVADSNPFGTDPRTLTRRLWELSARARLESHGLLDGVSIVDEVDALLRDVRGNNPRQRSVELLARLRSSRTCTLQRISALAIELLQAADRAGGRSKVRGNGLISRNGELCPLCSFPSHDWAEAGTLCEVARDICSHFSAWTPEAGCCAHCADRYLALRQASRAAPARRAVSCSQKTGRAPTPSGHGPDRRW